MKYADRCSNCQRPLPNRWTHDDIEGTYCCVTCLMVSLERVRDEDEGVMEKLVDLFRRFPPGNSRATSNARVT